MTDKQHDVFLSYSRKDTAIMEQVRSALLAEGISVWTDEKYLELGETIWQREIENAIKTSRTLIVLLSPPAFESKWVRAEIASAERHELRVFPFIIEAKHPMDVVPLSLRPANWIDARDSATQKTAIASLIQSVKTHIGIKTRSELEAEVKQLENQLQAQREIFSQEKAQLLLQLEQAQNTGDDAAALRAALATTEQELTQAKLYIQEIEAELKQRPTADVVRELRQQKNELEAQLLQKQADYLQLKDKLHEVESQRDQAAQTNQRLQRELQSRPTQGALDKLEQQKQQLTKALQEQKEKAQATDKPTQTLHRLHAWNPMDWLVLLWWMLIEPANVADYKEQYKNDNNLVAVNSWLTGTISCSMLLIPLVAVRFQSELVQDSIIVNPLWFVALGILWLGYGVLGQFIAAKTHIGSIIVLATLSGILILAYTSMIHFTIIFVIVLIIGFGVIGASVGALSGIKAFHLASEFTYLSGSIIAGCFAGVFMNMGVLIPILVLLFIVLFVIFENVVIYLLGSERKVIYFSTSIFIFLSGIVFVRVGLWVLIRIFISLGLAVFLFLTWNLVGIAIETSTENSQRSPIGVALFFGLIFAYGLLIYYYWLGGWRVLPAWL